MLRLGDQNLRLQPDEVCDDVVGDWDVKERVPGTMAENILTVLVTVFCNFKKHKPFKNAGLRQ